MHTHTHTHIYIYISERHVFTYAYHQSTKEMEWVTWVQILDEYVWISFYANALEKGMKLSLLPLSMDK